MKIYWYPDEYNVGDTLSRPILELFLPEEKIEQVGPNERGKLLAVGSILRLMREHDIVWGAGIMRGKPHLVPLDVKFLAVRGPLTRGLLHGGRVPEVYGDPGLLLPLMYRPEVEKKFDLGIVPHYVDRKLVEAKLPSLQFNGGEPIGSMKIIPVSLPWRKFVDEVLSCRRIVSSSLHGIVIAEAYRIPAEWAVYSDKVIGSGFKFRDYFMGTGRRAYEPGEPLPPIPDLRRIQSGLLGALYSHFLPDRPNLGAAFMESIE